MRVLSLLLHGGPWPATLASHTSGPQWKGGDMVRGFSVLAAQRLGRERWLRSLAGESRREDEEVREEEGGEPGEL